MPNNARLTKSVLPAAASLGSCGRAGLVVFATALLWLAPGRPAESLLAAPPQSVDIPQVKLINESMTDQWADAGLKPSPVEEDGLWCRRVYLDLIGRIPSVPELSEFLKDGDRNKRQRLVDKLLDDERYTEDFANQWAMIWSNILIGRSGGNANNSLINREGMAKYLRDSFARNKPYNQMVIELVTATGSTKPGEAGFNGAVNYLIDKVNGEEGIQATAATSKIFLGLQVQCTQCHNHPFNQWKQQKFWEFNAFFRQSRALRSTGRQRRGPRSTHSEARNAWRRVPREQAEAARTGPARHRSD